MIAVAMLVNRKSYSTVRQMTSVLTIARTRREAQRSSRRDAILDVAAQSFLVNGYAATTMSAIAAALGGSKGTLWKYFPSKELLFAAVIERVSDTFRQELTVILNPADDIDVALDRFCLEFLRKVTSPEAVAVNRLVMGETARFPEVGRIFYESAPRLTHSLLADYIATAMERGQLCPGDPLRAAQHLVSLCMSRGYQQLLLGIVDRVDPAMIRADVASALDTFLRAFRP